jgi:glycosyltransferase involved in cell wall biosynthesis
VVNLKEYKPMTDLMIKNVSMVRCGQLPDCHAVCHVNNEVRYYMRPVSTAWKLWSVARAALPGGRVARSQCVGKVATAASGARSPGVVISTEFLSTDERDGLFAMSDVLVHTSRSEGFGLRVAEAMASGLSVITTDKGAVADFTSADTVWQVESTYVDCAAFPCTSGRHPAVFGQPTKANPQWLNYSTQSLGNTMKAVWKQPQKAAEKAAAAKKYVAEHMSWSSVGALVRARITRLLA